MLAKISPPHVLDLVQSRDQAVVLDTELGIIHWEDCPHRLNWGNDACRASVHWDRDAYRNEECLEAVFKLMADKYPASACNSEPSRGA